MLGMTPLEVARTVGGKLRIGGKVGLPPSATSGLDLRLKSVEVDSRRVLGASLFVALPGARTDGHAHLPQALASGAGAALVRDAGALPQGMPGIVVRDTLAALQELARVHLARLQAEVVGITGSVGKTTAKDFLHQLLGGVEAGVHAAPASYNSEIGLPLAVLAAPKDCRLMVLEYGINAPGEMAALIGIAQPHHAWVTAFRGVHLEGMGRLSTVVREKCLLATAATRGVWMDDATMHMAAAHGTSWAAPLRLAGLESDGVEIYDSRPGAFRIAHPRYGVRKLPLVALHEVHAACMAATLAESLGVAPDKIGGRLEALERPPGRLTIRNLDGGITVLDDAYNASPASLTAALTVLRDWPTSGRRVAVLGTMHELGADSRRLHELAGSSLAAHGVDLLCAVGPGGAWFARTALAAGVTTLRCRDAAEAAALLASELNVDDVVLLKASRAEKLEQVYQQLARSVPVAEAPVAQPQ